MKSVLLVLAMLIAAPAGAQSLVPGPNREGRYEMQAIDGGVARLDTITGDVSLCRVEDETLRCRPSEDESAASEEDRGDDRAGAGRSYAEREPHRDRGHADEDTTDAEIDKAIDRLKRIFRAFGDAARDHGTDRDADEPNRT